MWIAHLPAGYLFAKLAGRRTFWQELSPRTRWKWLVVVLAGSVVSDLDVVIPGAAGWGHRPLLWLAVWAALSVVPFAVRKPRLWTHVNGFVAAVYVHLALDTLTAGVAWFWPFLSTEFRFFTIPEIYDRRIWNDVFHWTFAVEIVLVMAALWRLGAGPGGREDL